MSISTASSPSTIAPDPPADRGDQPAVRARGVRRSYGGGRFEAVRGVDLDVVPGELFALLGTNGAGKTSTLELLEGIAPADAGTIEVLGHDPYRARDRVRPQIGIMLQEAGFPGALTVREMTRLWHGTLDAPRPVDEVLELVRLEQRAPVPVQSLSGGERRRLDLALALLGRPRVLFLDEPTTGLDPQSRRATWDLVQDLLRSGDTTVLLTTHYLEEAEALADRIAIMHDGVVARSGTLTELLADQPSTIDFTVPDGTDLDPVRALGGAGTHLDRGPAGWSVTVETFDPQPLLAQLLTWAGPVQLGGLRVSPGSLEQAFLAVAGSPTRSTARSTARSTTHQEDLA